MQAETAEVVTSLAGAAAVAGSRMLGARGFRVGLRALCFKNLEF